MARLLVFLQTDCPTCQLITRYLNTLAGDGVAVSGLSQDDETATAAFIRTMQVAFPLTVDADLRESRWYDPIAVPTLLLVDDEGRVIQSETGFDKEGLNAMVALLGRPAVASAHDGAPSRKPGCTSRHLEPAVDGDVPSMLELYRTRGSAASRITLDDDDDPGDYCAREFGDPLPVVPPTVSRVERMLGTTTLDPLAVVGLIPPNYGEATVEKIAANAVMAGCRPEMMRVLIPLVRAAYDERFNMHGVQATTHSAAPLIIANGPVRGELRFWSRQNVFSNVARADAIDMSALGNPGKFSYRIAENEEENPWKPLHVERGLSAEKSAVTLFAADPPHGVSEHTARTVPVLLKAVAASLDCVWSYRSCGGREATVVLCPEHVKTIHHDGWSKQDVRKFLFDRTGVPVRAYRDDGGEGTQQVASYALVEIDGEPFYRKFSTPESIHVVVAGGTARKFSAVVGSRSSGPRGSQMVTYPV